MDQNLSKVDINEICYDLSVDVENLPDDTKSEMVVALLREVEQRGQIDRLIELLKEKRPNIPWRTIWARVSPLESMLEPNNRHWLFGGVALLATFAAAFFLLNGRFTAAPESTATIPVIAAATQTPSDTPAPTQTATATQTSAPTATQTATQTATTGPEPTNAPTETATPTPSVIWTSFVIASRLLPLHRCYLW